MKKIIDKKTIFSFIMGAVFILTIGVAASSLISSSDVSYNNSTSGLSSTNVKGALDELITRSNLGNATSSQILLGQTALVGGSLINGTMPNKAGWNSTPIEKGKVIIPAGYHDGSGYVDTNSVFQAGVDSVEPVNSGPTFTQIYNNQSTGTFDNSTTKNYSIDAGIYWLDANMIFSANFSASSSVTTLTCSPYLIRYFGSPAQSSGTTTYNWKGYIYVPSATTLTFTFDSNSSDGYVSASFSLWETDLEAHT